MQNSRFSQSQSRVGEDNFERDTALLSILTRALALAQGRDPILDRLLRRSLLRAAVLENRGSH